MTWRSLWSVWRAKSGISPKVKDDYAAIMSEAVRSGVNADPDVKKALLEFIKPFAFDQYKGLDGYVWAIRIPPMFVQWLSEERKKKITKKDLVFPRVTARDASLFTEAYSTKPSVQAHVRLAIIKFGKYILSEGVVTAYPFGGLKVSMPKKTRRTIFYNEGMLDDFYNVLLFNSERYYTLFFRLMIQTGLKPINLYYLTCGDIEYGKPQTDALDRTFYPILALKMYQREKRKIKEEVYRNKPPEAVYISESLKDDIKTWCDEKNLTGAGYLFKDFVILSAYDTFIRRRRKNSTIRGRLKFKDTKYIWYGLRETWAAVIYAITENTQNLIDLGGWESEKIHPTGDNASMRSCEALSIAKKWEIYLPPDKRDEILDIKGKCERNEAERVPGAPVGSMEEFDIINDIVEKLEKQLGELKRRR